MAITFQTISKDPDANLDYFLDWSAWLAPVGDTITSVEWIVPTGLTITAQLNTTTGATVWLSGGNVGKTYTVTSRIITTHGRTEDHSFNLLCEQH